MEEPIEETYFKWLYSNVAPVEVQNPSESYFTLLGTLHSTEFVWRLSGDDNRVHDGLDLRREFFHVTFKKANPNITNMPCSVLEMLVAFSRKAEFDTIGTSAQQWFWIFLDNLGLAGLNDTSNRVTERTNRVLDRFIWRTYSPSGENGGLFPLAYPHEDQRQVEIYYQFCEYLVDLEARVR